MPVVLLAQRRCPLLGALAAPAVVKAVRSFQDRAKRRGLNDELLVISPEQARRLSFPIGHPQKKLAYIGLSVDPTVYIPFTQFHSFLFEHKVAGGPAPRSNSRAPLKSQLVRVGVRWVQVWSVSWSSMKPATLVREMPVPPAGRNRGLVR